MHAYRLCHADSKIQNKGRDCIKILQAPSGE